jgi:hypothetical protein
MELNLNSLTAKLYRWFYNQYEMPNSLCPYFWKMIIMYVFIIPYSIISLPQIIFELITKERSEAPRIAIGGILYILLFFGLTILFTLVTLPIWGYFPPNSVGNSFQIIGTICFVGGLSVLITHLIINYRLNRNRRFIVDKKTGQYIKNPKYKGEKPNLVKEFIKAKYNKYCPKINWK